MRNLERSKYKTLLDDADFKRWYDNMARGSRVTAQEWFRRMGYICGKYDTTPKKIAKMTGKEASDFILDVISSLEKENRSGNYIANIVKPLKSWLAWNDVVINNKRIKIPRSQPTTVEDERTPTPDELRRILDVADIRAKVACSLVAFGGCRIEVLGNYDGNDGLKIRDIPELSIQRDGEEEGGTVKFEKVPTLVVIRKALSKAGHQYLSFLGTEGTRYLEQYLQWRMRRGEELRPETPLITFHERKGKYVRREDVGMKHITSVNMGDIIRKPIRAAGFSWRPYVLRRYFDARLMMAESDGLVIRDWRVFWMGHKGDIEHTYTVNKGVSEDIKEKMREAYGKAEAKYLATSVSPQEKVDVRAELKKQMLLVAGFSEREITEMDLSVTSDEDFQKMVRERLLGKKSNGSRQKVIAITDVESHLSQGWEYVASISSDKAILRAPVVTRLPGVPP